MKIIGTIESIQAGTLVTGPIEYFEVECELYSEGFAAMRWTLPEEQRILSVRVEG